jgi:hypothetical protein
MRQRSLPNFSKFIAAIVVGALSLPILGYVMAQASRPPRTNETQPLFRGIAYQRQAWSAPRPVMVHLVTIDLTDTEIRPFVTPGVKTLSSKLETEARTVSEFVNEFGVNLAINANFFHPFREETPWDFYPQTGDLVNNIGQSTSNQDTYSPGEQDWSSICFYDWVGRQSPKRQRVQIVESGICPTGTLQAVAGNDVLVKDGRAVPLPSYVTEDKPYPRTAIAIDKTGKKLWLVIVDGKQFQYSEGLTMTELTDFLLKLGVDSALNLDGGGSVTLAVQTPIGAKVLNAPIQTKLPMRERPVANQLGFFARPL